MNGNIFTGTLGILIVIALLVLIFIESTRPTKVISTTKTKVVPVPVRRPPYVRPPYRRPPYGRYY